jgi:serine/threonine protein kinase
LHRFKAVVRETKQTVAIKRIAIFDIMDSKSRKKTLREVPRYNFFIFEIDMNIDIRWFLQQPYTIFTSVPQVELLRNCSPHPHIIRYLDSFIDSNELYIVFEYVIAAQKRINAFQFYGLFLLF